jgi:hypothetical protein
VIQSNKTFLLIVTALTVVVTAVIVLVDGAWWLGPALCLPVAGLVFVGIRNQASVSQPMPPIAYAPPVQPPPPPAPSSVQVQDIVLPTADRDYKVRLRGSVFWRWVAAPADPHQRPEALAIDAVTERAVHVTSAEPAADYELVRHQLSAMLAVPAIDRSGLLEAWAQDIVLELPDADVQRLRELADLRKNVEVWERQRDHERDRRAYFHDDVLKSTGSALVWWLVQDVTKVSEAVALIGTLAQLSAVARDTRVDPLFLPFVTPSFSAQAQDSLQTDGFPGRGGDGSDFPTVMDGHDPHLPQDTDIVSAVRRLIDIALPESSEPDRARLADRLAGALSEMNVHELASKIREAFNAPDFNEILDEYDHAESQEPSSEPKPSSPFSEDNN